MRPQAAGRRRRRLTPYCRLPAVIRVIHSDRMSRFLVRRSLKAYCSDFSTRSRAILMQFLARPRNPLASLKIFPLFIMAPLLPPGARCRQWRVQGECSGSV